LTATYVVHNRTHYCASMATLSILYCR